MFNFRLRILLRNLQGLKLNIRSRNRTRHWSRNRTRHWSRNWSRHRHRHRNRNRTIQISKTGFI